MIHARPGGGLSNNGNIQTGQSLNNRDKQAVGNPSTNLDGQRNSSGPYSTMSIRCRPGCLGTWGANGEAFNHTGYHFIQGEITLFANTSNEFSTSAGIGPSRTGRPLPSLEDLTDR